MRFPAVAPEVERVAIRLKVEVKAARRRLAEVSLALGRHEGYLGKVLAAPEKLKMKTVFGVLAEVGLHPADFFLRIRPFESGGFFTNMQSLMEAASARPLNIDPEGKWTGPSEVPRLCQKLQLRIIEKGRTLREVSEALGFEPDHLSQILRGHVDLKVWHAYAVLGAVEVPHEDFFDDLYGLVGGAPNLMLPGGYMWSELRDLILRLNRQLDGVEGGAETPAPKGPGRRREEGAWGADEEEAASPVGRKATRGNGG